MTNEEYAKILYYQDNVEEEETSPLYRNGLFEIWGVTRTIDKSDYYVTVFLNAYMLPTGYLNENPIICRISITKPEYIMYDRLFTKEERQWFIDYITNNWEEVCNTLTWNYHDFGEEIMYNGSCPDYSLLLTSD